MVYFNSPGAPKRELLTWAKRVAQPRIYLEFPDMFLLCSQKKYDLQVLVWHGGWVRVARQNVRSMGFVLQSPEGTLTCFPVFSMEQTCG